MATRKPALGFIFVTLFLDILGIGLVAPILPRLIEELEHSDPSAAAVSFGILAASFGLMQFVFAPLLGSLSDRFGRRPVILGSLLGSGLDYLLLAYAPNLTWLFVGRIIAGITSANIAAANAYIADISPPEKRAQNYGVIGAAFGLGFIAGPALGGVLGNIGLRVPFLVTAGLTLLNCLYGALVLPESLAPENRRPFSWRRANPVGALLALRRHPGVFALAWTYFLITLAHQVFPVTWVLYTQHRYHWTVGQTGLSLALVGVMAVVVQAGLIRKIVPRLGERRSLLLGLTVATLSMIAYGFASEGWMVYALIVVASLGGITNPSLQAIVSRSVKANEQGAVQGALSGLSSVASIPGPLVATGLFSYFVGKSAPVYLPGAAFFFASLLTALALLMAWVTIRPSAPPPAPTT